MTTPLHPQSQLHPQTVDAIVIGAGFGGIYAVHKFANELGLSVIGFDKADGPGGTWTWNRYPGALSDTESHLYRYSFDRDLLQDGTWKHTYITQPEILEYLEGVVDRFDLRRHFRFGAKNEVTTAVYLDRAALWEVTTESGDVFRAKYVVNAVGLLSAINFPKLPGLHTFEGDVLHTGAWPEGKDMTGKRVGVIGTGSTGEQVVTELAPKVEHLTVFVRTPQYSVPVGKRLVTPEEIDAIKANYDEIWEQVKNSAVAFGFEESTVPAMSVSEEERNRVYEEAWQKGGGFRFMFATFGDIATDEAANETAAAFIRAKISEVIKDPEKARKLMPTGLYARRPLCDNGFYEAFNQPNVDVVAIKENPIRVITESGVVTEDDQLHELDVLIFATGFDAVDGNYRRMDIRGRDGLYLNDHWGGQPNSYLGVATAKFPNWFMVLGPNGPFTNLPPSIETQVEWISDVVKYCEANDVQAIEPTEQTVSDWTDTCTEIANMTLFTKIDSWIFGANIPGKKPSVLFYLGGLGNYRKILDDVARDGYRGFKLTTAKEPVSA
jgi:cyclohexanone monooxygenase